MATTTQPSNSETNFNAAIAQWKAAEAEYAAEKAALVAAIQQMVALAKSGHVGEAFQEIQTKVMPKAMQAQGGVLGQLAGTMNIASAIQAYVQEIQADANGGGNMTKAQAEQFVKALQEMFAELNGSTTHGPDTTPPWIGKNTAQSMLDAIKQICQLFGAATPEQLNPETVLADIQKWSTGMMDLQSPFQPPVSNTDQENLQKLQSAFTQWNNTAASHSQALNTQTQFAANTFNQFMNTLSGIYKAILAQEKSFLQNQKG